MSSLTTVEPPSSEVERRRVASRADAAVGRLMAWPVRWLMQPGSPVVLAWLRIATFGGLIYTGLSYDPRVYARLPRDLVLEPEVGGRFMAFFPLDPTVAGVAWVLMMAAAVAAMLGWRVAVTGTVAVILAVYVIGVTTMFGKVDHDHHLLWIGALLAVSPSSDALAIDARGKPRPGLSAVYGFPLRITWVMIGLIYLGAALPKLADGPAWALSDNLRNHMWIHWHVLDFTPVLRFDEWPSLYHLAGLATLAVEAGFVVALLWKVTRWVAIGAGLAFHVATYLMVGIFFPTLVACYVAFLPSKGTEPDDRRPRAAPIVVGFALLVAVALADAASVTNGWPVASYPAFQRTGPNVATYALWSDGEKVGRDSVGLNPDAWRFMLQRIGAEPTLTPVLVEHLGLDPAEVTLERTTVYPDPDDTRVVSTEQVWPTA